MAPGTPLGLATVDAGHVSQGRLCDFGSGMGVARLGQAASDTVIVTARRPLTCADAITLLVGRWSTVFASRGSGVQIPSAPPKPAGPRFDVWSCWLTWVRFVRFWERRCPIWEPILRSPHRGQPELLDGT